jgi:hypothetical protein
MPKQPKPKKTAADLLTEVGGALFDNSEDWKSRLAVTLDVRRDTIRDWLSGRLPFGADHGAFDNLLALLVKREAAIRQAKAELRKWLKRNREAG